MTVTINSHHHQASFFFFSPVSGVGPNCCVAAAFITCAQKPWPHKSYPAPPTWLIWTLLLPPSDPPPPPALTLSHLHTVTTSQVFTLATLLRSIFVSMHRHRLAVSYHTRGGCHLGFVCGSLKRQCSSCQRSRI